ncbi:MAG: hypothetical protein K6D38_01700 [Pseudobutyrivibrio sp.]|nr:hypothetical protein [Pseudobutyrivibrio sp.]
MKQKIINALTRNFGLKLLALVFSFLLWLAVVNVDDPTVPKTLPVRVNVINEDVLKDKGMTYKLKDGINIVNVKFSAKRSIMEKISSSDFTATADMEQLQNEERVPVTVVANSYENAIKISEKQNYLLVELEKEESKRFAIEAKTTGTLESGLEVEELKCSPTVITVKGPEGEVNKIAKVEALVDVTDNTSDFTDVAVPKFYDKKGIEIKDLSDLRFSVNSVNVSVHFANRKTVDIVPKTSGTLSSNLTLDEIKTDPSSVIIMGEPEALNNVSSITIPDSVINLSNLNGSFTTSVDISSYLPNGVSLAEGSPSRVTIYVLMAGESHKEVEIPASNISFTNVVNGQTVALNDSNIKINVFGSEDSLKKLDVSQIKGTIDCSTLTIGDKHNVVVQFDNPDGITIQNTSVSVAVAEDKNSNAQSTDNTEGNEE